jgi:hypothetical protein
VEERHDAFVHRACPQDLLGRHCRDRANADEAANGWPDELLGVDLLPARPGHQDDMLIEVIA